MIPMYTTLGMYPPVKFHLLTLPSMATQWAGLTHTEYFRLVVFVDQETADSSVARRMMIETALANGARSILCGGSYAPQLETEFDTVVIEHEIDGTPLCDEERGQVIPTTSHKDEPVGEILWQAAMCVAAHEDFEPQFPHVVVLMLSNDPRLPEVRRIGARIPDSLG